MVPLSKRALLALGLVPTLAPFLVTTGTTTTWTSPALACSCAMPPPLPSAPQPLPRNGVIRVPLSYPHVYHRANPARGDGTKTPARAPLELRSEATGRVVPVDQRILPSGHPVAELRPREPLPPGAEFAVYTPVPGNPDRAELRLLVTRKEDHAAPRWRGPVEIAYTPRAHPGSSCSSGDSTLLVRFAAIEDDDTPSSRLVIALWEGSEARPPDFSRPPDGMLDFFKSPKDGRSMVLLASENACDHAPLRLPAAGESPRRYGLKIADLAGNLSAAVELLVTSDGVKSLTPATETQEDTAPHPMPRRGGCGF